MTKYACIMMQNENASAVKEKVEECMYVDSPVNATKVDKIQVNKMNKLIRTANYDHS